MKKGHLGALVAAVVFACGGSEEESTGACAPALGASPTGCPQSAPAEAAFVKIKSTCGVVDADLDVTTPASPTLTAAGKTKLCSTCDCRKAVYEYQTLYANCTGSDAQNTALARNMHAVAAACP